MACLLLGGSALFLMRCFKKGGSNEVTRGFSFARYYDKYLTSVM